MSARRSARLSVALVSGAFVVTLATPALAVCDSYSGACPEGAGDGTTVSGTTDGTGAGGTNVGGTTEGAGTGGSGTTVSNGGKLPVTGGELVLLSAVGIGALVGGTALVLAGRRRNVLPV